MPSIEIKKSNSRMKVCIAAKNPCHYGKILEEGLINLWHTANA
jgi:hypothetical protein